MKNSLHPLLTLFSWLFLLAFMLPSAANAQITVTVPALDDPLECNTDELIVPVSTTTCPDGILLDSIYVDLFDDGSIDLEGVGSLTVNTGEATHRFFIVTKDRCGNVLNSEFVETVVDALPPVAICDGGIKMIDLATINDIYYLKGSDLDDGSFDRCGSVSFEVGVPSLGLLFADSIALNINHLGIHTAILRVMDDAGNSGNGCFRRILVSNSAACVNDTDPPIVSCNDFINVSLSPANDSATVSVDIVDESSYDLCSNPVSLSYTILDAVGGTPIRPAATSHSFGRQDIGTQPYRLYVADTLGNVDSCEGELNISRPPGLKLFSGTVFVDANQNCELDGGEAPLEGWRLRAEAMPSGNTAWGGSGADGSYSMGLLPASSDTLFKVYLINALNLAQPCQTVFYIDPDTLTSNNCQIDFPLQLVPNCSQLSVDIAAPFLRRCFNTNYSVNYCNYGTITAQNAYVEVTLDSFLTYVSSTIPVSSVLGQTYTFDLGDIASGECGSFQIEVNTSCNSVLGQTHCSTAHIYPDNPCHAPSEDWSGASIEVNGYCRNDTIIFEIQNTGTIDMPNALDYIITEDIIIHKTAPFQLQAGEKIQLATPGKGRTCRIDAEQEPFHPALSKPTVTIERCGELPGGGVSLGFVNQLPQYDLDPFLAIDCQENRGSYDPNDKTASPTGVSTRHFIEANTRLEYKIRFQNTGTDTAFTVLIEDALPDGLDWSSLIPGASSHAYLYEMGEDGTARFLFENILLPDSTTNLAESQGFVNFTIEQTADNPIGTLIENEAAITFDFNEPIITNIAFHEIGKDFLAVASHEVFVPNVSLQVIPNPFRTSASIQLEGLPDGQHTFELYSVDGKLLERAEFRGSSYEVQRKALPAGLHFFTIKSNGAMIANGKLICH